MTFVTALRHSGEIPAAELAAVPNSVMARQPAPWPSGDGAAIGISLQAVAESLCQAVDLRAGKRVLDVAAGDGDAAFAAARAFRIADVEDLGFPDASFDVVLSTFGVMFAADHRRAVADLLRLVRPGGRIGMANWTPGGFMGRMLATLGRHAPVPGAKSPTSWGTCDWIEEKFGPHAAGITMTPRFVTFRYRSPDHWLEVFRAWYPPVASTFAKLDAGGQADLARDILTLIARFNRADDGRAVIPAEYLEIVIRRA